jgi:hypothetical protein
MLRHYLTSRLMPLSFLAPLAGATFGAVLLVGREVRSGISLAYARDGRYQVACP